MLTSVLVKWESAFLCKSNEVDHPLAPPLADMEESVISTGEMVVLQIPA